MRSAALCPRPAAPRRASPWRPSNPREVGPHSGRTAPRSARPPRARARERAHRSSLFCCAAAHLARPARPRRRRSIQGAAGGRTRAATAAATGSKRLRVPRQRLENGGPFRLTQSPSMARRDVAGRADTPIMASTSADADLRRGAQGRGTRGRAAATHRFPCRPPRGGESRGVQGPRRAGLGRSGSPKACEYSHLAGGCRGAAILGCMGQAEQVCLAEKRPHLLCTKAPPPRGKCVFTSFFLIA